MTASSSASRSSVPPSSAARARTRVRVSDELFDAFRLASADESPLHVDDDYARAAGFGGPVVYGVLGTLIALSGLEPRAEPRAPKRISMRCPGPILRGGEYDRTVEQDTEQRAVVNVHDGEQPLLQLTVDFELGSDDAALALPDEPPLDHYPPARVTTLSDFAVGAQVGGRYVPRWPHVGRVLDLLGLRVRGIGPFHAAVLMWASYLVGMEAPGRSALLGEVDARFSVAPSPGPFAAAATVKAVYDFASLLEMSGEVAGDGLAARVRVIAVHRTDG